MNQSTTTQSKSRFRPVKVATDGLPGGPLSAQNALQAPAARPAIIRAVVGTGTDGQPGKVVLARQDEMSQPSPRTVFEERLERYVQKIQASEQQQPHTPEPQSVNPPAVRSAEIPAINLGTSNQDTLADSVVTWTTPQVRQAINLSEASLIQPKTIRHTHSAHSAPKPHLRGWPEEVEAPAEDEASNIVNAQLQRAVEIDEQLNQIESRIENLQRPSPASIREQEILADPNTSELVAAISTAIVAAIQEKSEAEVLPKAKSLFEKSLQKHAVTLGERSDSVVVSDTSEQLASEAMFSSIAAQRQQKQSSSNISDTLSPTTLLENLRERIADYQRTMTTQTASEAADLVKLSDSIPNEIEPIAVEQPVENMVDSSAATASVQDENQAPMVQFKSLNDAALPLEAASWDVEDFRWSPMSNQMSTGGGEAIRNLLQVALSPTTNKTKRIAVAGAGRGQGTTTIATALARAGNQAGYKTLLIDADVASPQLSQTVGLSAKISWLNGIDTKLPLGEVVIRSKKTNLCLMPLSANVNRVAWPRFIFDNLGQMLAGVESYFDLILVDAGPASQLLDELSNPQQLLDGMILVDSTAKLKEIEVYQNRLQTFGIDNLVLAENRKSELVVGAA